MLSQGARGAIGSVGRGLIPTLRRTDPGKRLVEMALRSRHRPASRHWGADRGKPVDRIYLESFLDRHRQFITGRVMEIGGRYYTDTYGHDVTDSVVYDVAEGADVDVVGDLATGVGLADNSFDSAVVLQTLMMIHDIQGAADTIHRILKPGGVALVTVNFIAPNCDDPCQDMWQWNITPNALSRLMSDRFGSDNVTVESYGNFGAASSFLAGLAAEEVTCDLWTHEPGYEVLVAALVKKV